MFLSGNNKNDVYSCKPQSYYIEVGFKGVKIIKACLRDDFAQNVVHKSYHPHRKVEVNLPGLGMGILPFN